LNAYYCELLSGALALDSVSGWSVVMQTYSYYFPLPLSLSRNQFS